MSLRRNYWNWRISFCRTVVQQTENISSTCNYSRCFRIYEVNIQHWSRILLQITSDPPIKFLLSWSRVWIILLFLLETVLISLFSVFLLNMSVVVIDIECFNNEIVKELGLFQDNIVTGYSFLPPEECPKSRNVCQDAWLTKNLHLMDWDSGTFPYDVLKEVVQSVTKDQNCEFFAKGFEKCKVLSSIFEGKHFTNLEHFGCPTVSDLSFIDENGLFCDSFRCTSYPFRHQYTTHCAERKALLYGQWTKNFFNSCV